MIFDGFGVPGASRRYVMEVDHVCMVRDSDQFEGKYKYISIQVPSNDSITLLEAAISSRSSGFMETSKVR